MRDIKPDNGASRIVLVHLADVSDLPFQTVSRLPAMQADRADYLKRNLASN